jgi:hypothetical protein
MPGLALLFLSGALVEWRSRRPRSRALINAVLALMLAIALWGTG